jgi:hypothetical protein
MNVGGIWQHDAAEVTRGWCGIDVAIKAALAEVRQIACVIDVGVGEDDTVDLFRIKKEVAIPFHRLCTSTLIESAIEEDACFIDLDEML